jgi:hypothetical protein
MRTPLEAVGYFNLDAEIAAHLQWYHAWNTSVMGSPPPPLLVGMGPTPEDLLADYTNGLWIVLYTITALFGVCVVMVWLPLSATRCVWRCSLVVTLLVMNTIQMTVWGGVCYFRSASGAINQPPPYCLMSKSSAMGLFASGLIMTTLPFVVSFTDN